MVNYLVNAVIKNGNLLLNLGTDRLGLIPLGQVNILEEVGIWLHKTDKAFMVLYEGHGTPWTESTDILTKPTQFMFICLKDIKEKY